MQAIRVSRKVLFRVFVTLFDRAGGVNHENLVFLCKP